MYEFFTTAAGIDVSKIKILKANHNGKFLLVSRSIAGIDVSKIKILKANHNVLLLMVFQFRAGIDVSKIKILKANHNISEELKLDVDILCFLWFMFGKQFHISELFVGDTQNPDLPQIRQKRLHPTNMSLSILR